MSAFGRDEIREEPRPVGMQQYSGAGAGRQVGAEAPWPELAAREHRALVGLAVRYVGSPDDAEDVVQNAWLRVLYHASQYRGECPPIIWLRRIVVREALQLLRARRRDRHVPLSRLARNETPVMPDVVSSAAVGDERADVVDRSHDDKVDQALDFLRSLTTRQRYALVAFDVYGERQVDIARDLGVSQGTVKAMLHQIRRKAERMLTQRESLEHRPNAADTSAAFISCAP